MNDVGKIIRDARERAGFRQMDLAHELDMSVTTISNLENGGTANISTLRRIGERLGIAYAELRAAASKRGRDIKTFSVSDPVEAQSDQALSRISYYGVPIHGILCADSTVDFNAAGEETRLPVRFEAENTYALAIAPDAPREFFLGSHFVFADVSAKLVQAKDVVVYRQSDESRPLALLSDHAWDGSLSGRPLFGGGDAIALQVGPDDKLSVGISVYFGATGREAFDSITELSASEIAELKAQAARGEITLRENDGRMDEEVEGVGGSYPSRLKDDAGDPLELKVGVIPSTKAKGSTPPGSNRKT